MKTIYNSPSDLVSALSPGSPLIQMSSIVKIFHTTAGNITVLKGIDAEIFPGEFVSIVGRSGSGKSTLLNMLTGIDHPTSGSVTIGGTMLHTLNESQLASWRGRNMGIVFQFFQLLPMLTLIENVMLPMDFCETFSPTEREDRALQLLARVGLQGFEHKMPGAVSGGQQQSAAVARALATDPPILVADEPTGNLDTRTAEQVMQLFQELVIQGKTIIMVTHDSSLAEQTQRSIILADGELIHPAVAAAFPKANHSTLLKLHHLAQPVTIAPGQELPPELQLIIIVSGSVLVSPATGLNHSALPTEYQPVQLLDLNTLRRAGMNIRAGSKHPLQALKFDESAVRALAETPLKAGSR